VEKSFQRQIKEKPLRMTNPLLAYRRLFRKGKSNKDALDGTCSIVSSERILA
jgi:hypothetical protein